MDWCSGSAFGRKSRSELRPCSVLVVINVARGECKSDDIAESERMMCLGRLRRDLPGGHVNGEFKEGVK